MRRIPSELPVYGGDGKLLFHAEGDQIQSLVENGLAKEVGSKRWVRALYWIGEEKADESELMSLKITVGTKTVFRETCGDSKVWTHRKGVCLAWGTA